MSPAGAGPQPGGIAAISPLVLLPVNGRVEAIPFTGGAPHNRFHTKTRPGSTAFLEGARFGVARR